MAVVAVVGLLKSQQAVESPAVFTMFDAGPSARITGHVVGVPDAAIHGHPASEIGGGQIAQSIIIDGGLSVGTKGLTQDGLDVLAQGGDNVMHVRSMSLTSGILLAAGGPKSNGWSIRNVVETAGGTPRLEFYNAQSGTIGMAIEPNGRIKLRDGAQKARADIDISGSIRFDKQKACSVVTGGNWRDTIIVPSSWSADTCAKFQQAVGANDVYQLLCIFDNSFSIGSPNGGKPDPNCGW